MKRKTLVIGASVIGVAAVGTTVALEPLAADPDGEKDCGDVLPKVQAPLGIAVQEQVPEPRWAQKGGTVNDASCVDRTAIAGVIAPVSEREAQQALTYAKAKGLTISPAGVRHSMGGHAFRRGGLMLDMRKMNAIRLDPEKSTVTVGAGATWHDIQNAIHSRFAVKAMQSTDIFTVGGSISVNAHGMDHQAGAIRDSIRSLRVLLGDGQVVTVSRTENPELFDLIVGGYGLFGIILSAELDVVPNAIYRSERELIPTSDLPGRLTRIIADPSVGLMYTHISTAPGSLLDEALIYTYHHTDESGAERAPLAEVGSVKMRRLTVNLAKKSTAFRSFKWWAEKNLEHRAEACTVTRAQAMKDGEACLVSRNDPMHDSVPYLRNALKNDTDILQEYFIPRDQLLPFIDGLRTIVRQHDANLLNASVRVVGKEDNRLTYAPAPAYSVVLYFNQRTDADGNARMARLTSELIDLARARGGRFFLPYQLYYSPEQLVAAYPEVREVFAAKRKWDPDGLFSNTWYERYAPAVG
ncbi:FAD-binding oxidoreductase [Sphingomonas daechungensis]|uniref:FAD-binding oxidoreductase n=1 Tax=Sphingomonas daechungensis TaxID=1176646 RepID=UPI00378421CD